jgi:5'-methylthioadenosine phosphorylase
MVIGIITGSGMYDFPGIKNKQEKTAETPFGPVQVETGTLAGKEVVFIARHGKKHVILPNMINYRATMHALKELGCTMIIATTVCGVIDPELPLAQPIIFDDLFFIDNRLPNGELCTMYTKQGDAKRGHFIFSSVFNEGLRKQFSAIADNPITSAVYAHVNGPRFNSKAEIKKLQQHASCVSQTAGPEAVLAGELEIPYMLLGFGVDYANGVKSEPTPVNVLQDNLACSNQVFCDIITKFLKIDASAQFEGFVYRFE